MNDDHDRLLLLGWLALLLVAGLAVIRWWVGVHR